MSHYECSFLHISTTGTFKKLGSESCSLLIKGQATQRGKSLKSSCVQQGVNSLSKHPV